MDSKLVYPTKGFLRSVKNAVRKGYEIEIIILPGWQKRMLIEELPGLLSELGGDQKQNCKFIFRMLLLLRFFTAYLYAKSGDYRVSYLDDEELVISLKPPEKQNKGSHLVS